MKKFAHITFAVGAMAGTLLGFAASATAAPTNSTSAENTVNRLQALGYNVALNGSITAPLSVCSVVGVHPDDPGTVAPKQFTTIWLEVSCPPTNN
jgi:hypothetical protein